MDNRFLYVQQAVDTTFRLQIRDENKQLLQIGLQENYRAEVHFYRKANDKFVGKLSSGMGHVRFVPTSPNVEEAMYLTFKNNETATWPLEAEPRTISFDEDNSQVVMGIDELYGTLLIRDASDNDVPNASGCNLPVMMESSTTLEFTSSVGGLTENDEA